MERLSSELLSSDPVWMMGSLRQIGSSRNYLVCLPSGTGKLPPELDDKRCFLLDGLSTLQAALLEASMTHMHIGILWDEVGSHICNSADVRCGMLHGGMMWLVSWEDCYSVFLEPYRYIL